jgi:broad specificity phosphatase PhoE
MSEINLLLVRHGEAAESWGNHPDPGLSELGIKQSASLINNELEVTRRFPIYIKPKITG